MTTLTKNLVATESAAPDLAPLVPGRLADHTTCLALKIGQVVFRLMENRLASLGLRVRHYSVLETLFESGPMPQQDLGNYLRIDGATMVATIDDLEKFGYVTRTRSAADRRSYDISLLAQGRTVLRRLNVLMDDLDGDLFADLTKNQQTELHYLLGKLSRGENLIGALDDIRSR